VAATIAAIDEQARVTLLNMGPVAVSSTLVRERLAGGQAIVDLVGPEVAHYIAAHGLYATPDRAAVS
jgi:nicotinic acid mononucleotide adenylyltransferase